MEKGFTGDYETDHTEKEPVWEGTGALLFDNNSIWKELVSRRLTTLILFMGIALTASQFNSLPTTLKIKCSCKKF